MAQDIFCGKIVHNGLSYNVYLDGSKIVWVAKVNDDGVEITSNGKYQNNIRAENEEHALEMAKSIIDHWGI
ncbi:hypothetical protein BH09BAC5_BH09BAC5_06270 [soil metagenome]